MLDKFGPIKVPRTKRLEPALHTLLATELQKAFPELHMVCQVSRVSLSRCLGYLDMYILGQSRSALAHCSHLRGGMAAAAQSSTTTFPSGTGGTDEEDDAAVDAASIVAACGSDKSDAGDKKDDPKKDDAKKPEKKPEAPKK